MFYLRRIFQQITQIIVSELFRHKIVATFAKSIGENKSHFKNISKLIR